jgi:hypothetical protein
VFGIDSIECEGYWLGSFHSAGDTSILQCTRKEHTHLRKLLSLAGLVEDVGWRVRLPDVRRLEDQIEITAVAWLNLFASSIHGNAKQHVQFAPWVLSDLSCAQIRTLLRGLQSAHHTDASIIEQARCDSAAVIFATSAIFREQIMQACVHAGYSPAITSTSAMTSVPFKESDDCVWCISIREADIARSTFCLDGDRSTISTSPYDASSDGRLWCVQLAEGTDRLLMAQRAHRDSKSGEVSEASCPIVVGNCFAHQKVYTYIQSRFYRAPEVINGCSYSAAIESVASLD